MASKALCTPLPLDYYPLEQFHSDNYPWTTTQLTLHIVRQLSLDNYPLQQLPSDIYFPTTTPKEQLPFDNYLWTKTQ